MLSATPFPSVELGASFSPDGKWLVYSSGDAGRQNLELYVEPFPATGEKRRISQERGVMPLWSPAGNELFYRPVTSAPVTSALVVRQTLKSIRVSTEPSFSFSSGQVLPVEEFLSFSFYRSFDVTPDGQRFLVVLPAEPTDSGDAPNPSINVVLNWFEELKERVPVP